MKSEITAIFLLKSTSLISKITQKSLSKTTWMIRAHFRKKKFVSLKHSFESSSSILRFMTTPRFEFWLLLHVSDVATEYADELSKMLDPSDKSVNIHLLEKTGTNKKIHQKTFEQYFLPNIDNAIERASSFCTQRDDLLNQLGSNLGELFSILRD